MNRRQFLTRTAGVALTPVVAMAGKSSPTVTEPLQDTSKVIISETVEHLKDELARFVVSSKCRVFFAHRRSGEWLQMNNISYDKEWVCIESFVSDEEFMIPTDLLLSDLSDIRKRFKGMAASGDCIRIIIRGDRAGICLVKWFG